MINSETAPKLGQEVGASKVIVGSFSFVGSVIQISARMVDVETNTIVGGVAANVVGDIAGSKSDVFGLAHQLASRFHRALTGEDLPTLTTGELPPQAQQAAQRIDPEIAGAFERIANGINPLRQIKNSPFKVSVSVDRGYGATYKFGEPLTITFSSESDTYLRLYDIDSQRQVSQLYPNRWEPSAMIKAGEIHTFPPKGARWKLSLEGVPGEEIILAIATKNPADFPQAEGAQEFIGKSVIPQLKEQGGGSWATSEVRFYTEEPKGPLAGKYVYIPVSPMAGGAKGLEVPMGKGFDSTAVQNYEDGISLQLLGRPEEAEEALLAALKIEPKFAEAHAALGSVYFAMGMKESTRLLEAIREFQEVITDKPDDSLAHYNLGVTYYALGQNVEAVSSLKDFLNSNPAGEIAEKAQVLLVELSPPPPPPAG
jgi:tetratricopeptide (TPR) repeat protein